MAHPEAAIRLGSTLSSKPNHAPYHGVSNVLPDHVTCLILQYLHADAGAGMTTEYLKLKNRTQPQRVINRRMDIAARDRIADPEQLIGACGIGRDLLRLAGDHCFHLH